VAARTVRDRRKTDTSSAGVQQSVPIVSIKTAGKIMPLGQQPVEELYNKWSYDVCHLLE